MRPYLHLQVLEGGAGALTLTEHWPFVVQQFSWVDGVPTGLPQTMADGAKIQKSQTLLPSMPGRVLRVAAKAKEIDGAYSLDLTDGRALLSLNGPEWRWTLMKGCGLDFEAMKAGDCAVTILFKINVVLWVTEQDEVQILVSYAFARALAEKIKDASDCRIVVAV